MPWSALLSSVPLWALVVAQLGHDWGFYIMVTDLPKYLNDALHVPIQINGYYSAAPYIGMLIASIVSSYAADLLINKKYLTITNTRKICGFSGRY